MTKIEGQFFYKIITIIIELNTFMDYIIGTTILTIREGIKK